MKIFTKLLFLAAAVGAGYASVQIARKYDENKQKEIMEDDFDSTKKENVFQDVKNAAVDVYVEKAEKVKKSVVDTAENIGINTDEIGSAFGAAGVAAVQVGKAVANASVKVAEKVKTEAPVVVDGAKTKVGETVEQIKGVVENVGDKIKPKGEVVDAEIYDEDDFEEVAEPVEAEVTEETEVDPFDIEE